MGWRDICRATDERTVIASVVPLAGVGQPLPLVLDGQSKVRAETPHAFWANLTAWFLTSWRGKKLAART
jgi:hypothetical protein